MNDIIMTILIGLLVSIPGWILAIFLYKKSKTDNEELKKILEEQAIEGKKEKTITIIKQPQPEPKPQLQSQPQPITKYPYDLSTGTTAVVGEGRMSYGTSDIYTKKLFDYGVQKLGEKVIDSILDSVFEGEEYIYECPECGAEIDEDDTECPNCGADLEED